MDENVPACFKSLVIKKPLSLDKQICLKFRYTLTHLSLSDTKLRNIPDFLFYLLPNLSWLDLRTNRLKTIPFSVSHHKRLTTLLLDENIVDHLPVYLGLVHSPTNVPFRDNIINYLREEILRRGWTGITIYLLQYMEEKKKEEAKLV